MAFSSHWTGVPEYTNPDVDDENYHMAESYSDRQVDRDWWVSVGI